MYVTDVLGGIFQADTRYFDLIRPQPEEMRTAEEIIAHIRAKLGGEP